MCLLVVCFFVFFLLRHPDAEGQGNLLGYPGKGSCGWRLAVGGRWKYVR